jgi:hypothetical protein
MPQPRSNLSGQKFGKLLVISKEPHINGKKQAYWDCVCDCGREVLHVAATSLKKALKDSCGKCHKPFSQASQLPRMVRGRKAAGLPLLTPVSLPEGSKRKDLTGMTFGRWKVFGASAHNDFGWIVQCQCGTIKDLPAGRLTSGTSLSCGCARGDLLKALNSLPPAPAPHFVNRPTNPLYVLWLSIKTRCFNKKNKAYKGYGGRGITMHEPWRRNFRAFAADVGQRPGDDYSLDRIDNDKGYYPDNVRWATRVQQADNTRANPFVVYQGQKIRIRALADELGIPRNVLSHYALKVRLPLDRAIDLCHKAVKVLEGTASKADMDALSESSPPQDFPPVKNRTSFIDLTGRQLGPWKVIAYVGKAGRTYPTEWLCQHDHGHRSVVDYTRLKHLPWLNQPEDLPPDHVVPMPDAPPDPSSITPSTQPPPQNNWV